MARLQEGVRQQQLFIDRWMEGGLSVTDNIRILGTVPTAFTSHCNRCICLFLKKVRPLQGPHEKAGDQHTGETSCLLWSSTEKWGLRLTSPEGTRAWTRAGSYTAAYKQLLEVPSHGSPARSHRHFRCGREQPKLSLCLTSMSPRSVAWDRSPSVLRVTGSFPAGWKCLNDILWSSQLTVPGPSSLSRETL